MYFDNRYNCIEFQGYKSRSQDRIFGHFSDIRLMIAAARQARLDR